MPTICAEPPLLQVTGITRRFGGVQALRGVDFELRVGEVHALLGENGAGKSTLIKILAGVHRPDSGSVRVDGRERAIRSVADANALGIRVIHQELSLAPNLSIAENICLGVEPRRLGLLRRRKMLEDSRALVLSLGLPEISDVGRQVQSLSLAHRQLVEIARALSTEARVLILDEPTSALSGPETEALFATLRRLRSSGVGIVYISHRLEEILRLADRITVLRDGKSVGMRSRAEVNVGELVRWMVDREISEHLPRPAAKPGATVLDVEGLSGGAFHDVSFSVRRGEIFGIAGLVGSGRSELARAIYGIDRIWAGSLRVEGQETRIMSPRDAIRRGIVLVPEDRAREGLILIQSLGFNLALPWTRRWSRGIRPDLRLRGAIISRCVDSLRIKAASADICVASLSGGNQQKALVGRWMEEHPRLLILDEPTRGVDVGARQEMFSILGGLVESGMAVLLISSDLAEVLSLSHRVAIFRDGRILDTVNPAEVTLEQVMSQLTGVAGEKEAG